MDDIRQKLADKKEKQLEELRRIEDDIAAGRLERPLVGQALGQPIPGEWMDNGHVGLNVKNAKMTKNLVHIFDHVHVSVAKRQPVLGSPLSQWAGHQPPHQRRLPPHHRPADAEGPFTPHQLQQPPHRPPDWSRGAPNQLSDHSGRYRSYRDSSGDQGEIPSSLQSESLPALLPGDVDSGDELSLGIGRPTLGPPPPRPRPPGPSPGPRHRERVVIGGYTYETPL